jgi:hypothetical protein
MKKYWAVLSLVFFVANAFAQQNTSDTIITKTDTTASIWSFGADGYYYLFPNEGEENTGTFVGYADYKTWHIEARYNYEDLKTGSLFGGYRFETGDKITLGATPMLGIVFGNTNGIAPALELDVTWKKLDFYSESEYVFDFESQDKNFFYTWSELAITPFEKFRTGMSVQKTKLFETDLDLQRGVFAQYSFWKLTAGVYYFNPFNEDTFFIASLGIEF